MSEEQNSIFNFHICQKTKQNKVFLTSIAHLKHFMKLLSMVISDKTSQMKI